MAQANQSIQSAQPRTNMDLTVLHQNAADLLRRIASDPEHVTSRDRAMAGIYAAQLERRASVSGKQQRQ